MLTVFHEDKQKLKEWYILSKDEYVNLEKYIVSDVYNFVVNIPTDWNYVSLMVDDSIVPVSYTHLTLPTKRIV